MSSSYTRTTVRGWAAAAATATGVKYYETINTEQNPSDAVWWTLEFVAEFSEKLSFCNTWQEEGLVEVIVSGDPGTGDTAVIDAAERIRDELLKNTDPANKLTLGGPNPPSEYSGGSGKLSWYEVVISIDYKLIN